MPLLLCFQICHCPNFGSASVDGYRVCERIVVRHKFVFNNYEKLRKSVLSASSVFKKTFETTPVKDESLVKDFHYCILSQYRSKKYNLLFLWGRRLFLFFSNKKVFIKFAIQLIFYNFEPNLNIGTES